MKLEPKYRYVAWDVSGDGYSYGSAPTIMKLPVSRMRIWWMRSGENINSEPLLEDCCPGEWDERVYDMEDENDRLLILALMEL